jgi:hypothetical protein
VGRDVMLCTAFENLIGSQAIKKVNISLLEENNTSGIEFPIKISAKNLYN